MIRGRLMIRTWTDKFLICFYSWGERQELDALPGSRAEQPLAGQFPVFVVWVVLNIFLSWGMGDGRKAGMPHIALRAVISCSEGCGVIDRASPVPLVLAGRCPSSIKAGNLPVLTGRGKIDPELLTSDLEFSLFRFKCFPGPSIKSLQHFFQKML